MRSNKTGFAAIEIIVAILLLGIVVSVALLIHNNRNEQESLKGALASIADYNPVIPDDWVRFEGEFEDMTYAFYYPKNWETGISLGMADGSEAGMRVKSPNYYDIMDDGRWVVTSGSHIDVRLHREEGATLDTLKERVDSTDELFGQLAGYHDVEEKLVNSVPALTYTRMPNFVRTVKLVDGVYIVTFEQIQEFGTKDTIDTITYSVEHSDIFNKIIASFHFINK